MAFAIIGIVIVVLLLLYLLVAYIMAGSIVHLNRQPVPRNPRHYAMNFEGIQFRKQMKGLKDKSDALAAEARQGLPRQLP